MKKFLAFLFVLLCGQVQAQSCTGTPLDVGANVASAVSSASPGAVICLNSGDWGTVNLSNIVKSNYVTIRSTTGVGAMGSWLIAASRFIRLASVTGYIQLTSCSRDIYILNTVGTPNTGEGIIIDGSSCSATAQNITIDGAVLDRIGQTGGEGRLSVRAGNTITIRNSQFLGVWAGSEFGPSDGIQLFDEANNITIGPNNLFRDIHQEVCSTAPAGPQGPPHCDMIQNYTGNCTNIHIDGNLFKDSSTFILTESRCTGTNTFTNNVLVNIDSGQWHTWANLDWSHNTVYNSLVIMNSLVTFTSSATINNNIFHDSSFISYDYDGGGPGTVCQNCTYSHNVYTSGCTGTNCITGTPTYSGGAPSSSLTYQGWRLSAGSIGKGNASDGKDRGTNYFAPAAPTNFQYN